MLSGLICGMPGHKNALLVLSVAIFSCSIACDGFNECPPQRLFLAVLRAVHCRFLTGGKRQDEGWNAVSDGSNGGMSRGFPELFWSLSRVCLEETHEMLWIFEPEFSAYTMDAQSAVVEQLLGGIQQIAGDKVLCRLSGLHSYEASEVTI